MPKIICPWDMCIYNARTQANVESICTREVVELEDRFENMQSLLKCKNFKSFIGERRKNNA
jgi:hypothetical protein